MGKIPLDCTFIPIVVVIIRLAALVGFPRHERRKETWAWVKKNEGETDLHQPNDIAKP
jgi:hypothetical protein